MTVIKEVFVCCDHGGLLGPHCETRWTGNTNQTAFAARTDAHAAGWRFRRSKDWCPEHSGVEKP